MVFFSHQGHNLSPSTVSYRKRKEIDQPFPSRLGKRKERRGREGKTLLSFKEADGAPVIPVKECESNRQRESRF